MPRLFISLIAFVFAYQSLLMADGVAELPVYSKEQTVSGRLRSVGSDSMDELMKTWELVFKMEHPELHLFHQGKGSDTAIPLLIEGRVEFGPMSRPLSGEELKSFEDKLGKAPLQIPVAVDAIAIYVHPGNPVAKQGLSIDQLKKIFMSGEGAAKTWGDVGVTGPLANQSINLYSRNVVSGTRAVFRKAVLDGADFGEVVPLPSSKEVVESVAADPLGIGYSSLTYNDGEVALVPVSKDVGGEPVSPLVDGVPNRNYPLLRELFLVVNVVPGDPSGPVKREFIKFVLSREGQEIVSEHGLMPVAAADAQRKLKELAALSEG
ncbi:MAG: PstS family phosphate ABC transporter substrate-binding protein [Puniceicoccales bacterium]